MSYLHTTRFRRGRLPHWEVEGGRYFVTVRLADSLPKEAVLRMREMQENLARIEPASAQFADLQRVQFLTLEKYLDAGAGDCVLRESGAAEIVVAELTALGADGVAVPHYSVMPNHWHALLVPSPPCALPLAEIMKRLKGRTAKRLRARFGGAGPLWQREWFDRWIRDDAEWTRTVAYIRHNPVKAGLAPRWEDHPWTK